MDVFGKIDKVVIVCSTIQALRPKTPVKTTDTHFKPNSAKYSPSEKPKSNLESIQNKKNQAANLGFKIEHEALPTDIGQGAKGNNLNIEDSFTNYINRVRISMRTKSTVGDAPNVGDVSDFDDGIKAAEKDEFSEYLDRARIKIRTTSSIGNGRF